MYLSHININPQKDKTRILLGSRQVAHASVLSCFSPSQSEQRVLWRLEKDSQKVGLFIMSEYRPSMNVLNEQFGWENDASNFRTVDYDGLLKSLSINDRMSFSITINPTRTVTGGNKRYGLESSEVPNWLDRKLASVGAELNSASIDSYRKEKFRRGDSYVTLGIYETSGELTVKDVDLIQKGVMCGIGSAKGYGCGMLLLNQKITSRLVP